MIKKSSTAALSLYLLFWVSSAYFAIGVPRYKCAPPGADFPFQVFLVLAIPTVLGYAIGKARD